MGHRSNGPEDRHGIKTPMYTMSLYAVGRKLLAQGMSREGERWEDTLLRLYQETRPQDEPRRRIIYMTYHGGQLGSPTNMVITGYSGPVPDETTDPPLLVQTDPPQF